MPNGIYKEKPVEILITVDGEIIIARCLDN